MKTRIGACGGYQWLHPSQETRLSEKPKLSGLSAAKGGGQKASAFELISVWGRRRLLNITFCQGLCMLCVLNVIQVRICNCLPKVR